MKSVMNPHIPRTLLILYLFEVFKTFWDFIWFGYCLNRFTTLRRWWNDFQKNPNPKILKYSQGYEVCEESSFFVPSQFTTCLKFLNFFLDFILLGYSLNKFLTLRRWSHDIRKNPNPKILKNLQGYKECEESSHSSCPPNSPLGWSF